MCPVELAYDAGSAPALALLPIETRLQGLALADLREHRPWHADRIHVPVVVGYGTTGATHHRQGMTLAAETIRNAQLVVLDGCGHGAPNTNAEAFRRHLIDPLFATVGAPWRR